MCPPLRAHSFDVPLKFTLSLGQDVIDWFTAQGIGCRAKMNAVLRDYVDAQKRCAGTISGCVGQGSDE